jgi:hypothetical protein
MANLHVVAVQLSRLDVDALGEQAHKSEHLVGRAAPVFGRKRVDGQDVHAGVCAGNRDATHVFGAGVVSGEAWQAAPIGPATVAIHDDADVRRHRVGARL